MKQVYGGPPSMNAPSSKCPQCETIHPVLKEGQVCPLAESKKQENVKIYTFCDKVRKYLLSNKQKVNDKHLDKVWNFILQNIEGE